MRYNSILPKIQHWNGALIMKTDEPQSNDPPEFVKRSSVYQEFLAEREEILKHKWLESERVGKDIGSKELYLMGS